MSIFVIIRYAEVYIYSGPFPREEFGGLKKRAKTAAKNLAITGNWISTGGGGGWLVGQNINPRYVKFFQSCIFNY